MKRPKLSRYPKRPKSGASVEVLKRYEDRTKDVRKKNEEKLRPYNVWKKVRESVLKTVDSIRHKVYSNVSSKKRHSSPKRKHHRRTRRR